MGGWWPAPAPERYRASGNVNNFKGDRRISVLAQSNNVNEQNFGTDDLLGVVGNSNQGGGGRGGRRRAVAAGGGGGGGNGGNAGDFLVNQSGGITTHQRGGPELLQLLEQENRRSRPATSSTAPTTR